MRASAPSVFAGDKQLATREFVLKILNKIDEKYDQILDTTNSFEFTTHELLRFIKDLNTDNIKESCINKLLNLFIEYKTETDETFSIYNGNIIKIKLCNCEDFTKLNEYNLSDIIGSYVCHALETNDIKYKFIKLSNEKLNPELLKAFEKLIPSSILSGNFEIYDKNNNPIKFIHEHNISAYIENDDTINQLSYAINNLYDNNVLGLTCVYIPETNIDNLSSATSGILTGIINYNCELSSIIEIYYAEQLDNNYKIEIPSGEILSIYMADASKDFLKNVYLDIFYDINQNSSFINVSNEIENNNFNLPWKIYLTNTIKYKE